MSCPALSLLAHLLLAAHPRPVPTPELEAVEAMLRRLDYPSRSRGEILEWLAGGGSVGACESIEPWHSAAIEVVWRGLEVECWDGCEACAEDSLDRQRLLNGR